MSKQIHTSIDNLDETLHALGGLIEALDTVVHDMPAFTSSTRDAQMLQALINSISHSATQAVTQSAEISRDVRKGKADV